MNAVSSTRLDRAQPPKVIAERFRSSSLTLQAITADLTVDVEGVDVDSSAEDIRPSTQASLSARRFRTLGGTRSLRRLFGVT